MNIAVVGVNHHATPIEIREIATFTNSKKVAATNDLLEQGLSEVVILSTCNRSEIYFHADHVEEKIALVKMFFVNFFHSPQLKAHLFSKTGEKAVSHLFTVSAGLDSIALGEDQILGQVKVAYEFALDIGSSKKVFNKLFRLAIETAKEIKSTTGISQKPRSISYITLKYLKEKIRTFNNQKVMIIGTGKMSRLVLKYLTNEKPQKIYLANRNIQKSSVFKKEFPGIQLIEYEKRYDFLNQVDIIISATAAPHLIIKKEDLPKIKNPLIIIDLALPRDIDPKLTALAHIQLYDLDMLKGIQDENEEERQQLVQIAEKIIKAQVLEFTKWLSLVNVDATIHSLNHRCEEIKEDAVAFLEKKLTLTQKDKQLIDSVTAFALKRLVRDMILYLKQVEDKDVRETYVKVVKQLFNLNS